MSWWGREAYRPSLEGHADADRAVSYSPTAFALSMPACAVSLLTLEAESLLTPASAVSSYTRFGCDTFAHELARCAARWLPLPLPLDSSITVDRSLSLFETAVCENITVCSSTPVKQHHNEYRGLILE